MIKNIIKKVSVVFSLLFLILVIITGTINIKRVMVQIRDDYSFLNNQANKVILFIGDGMGQNQVENGKLYLQRDLFFESFEKKGYMQTNSKNTYTPTDSAAAATAMATGKKVYNTKIGGGHTSITELAKQNNLGAGIVTTDTLTGATPAAFSSHVAKRSMSDKIVLSQLEHTIDLYLGVKHDSIINCKTEFEEKGYEYISKYSELKPTSNKLVGAFDKIYNYEVTLDMPTLPILTEYAINYFETNYPDGYFLMIEGAHIDKSNHSNDIYNMIKYLDEFDNSIKKAYEMVGNNSDTAIIVTADHESGDLSLAKSIDKISNDLYKSTGHTANKVYYYIHQKENEQLVHIDENIDNTHIFAICKELLNL